MGGARDDDYPLHALLRLREQQEAALQRSVAAAVGEVTDTAHALEARRVDHERALAAERAAMERAHARAAAGVAAGELVNARRYADRLTAVTRAAAAAVTAAEQALAAAEAAAAATHAAYAAAIRERKALQTHHERWQTKRTKARTRD